MKTNLQNKLPRKNKINSQYHIIKFVRLVARFLTINPSILHEGLEELISKVEFNVDWTQVGPLLGKDDLRRAVFYFLDYGAATSLILQNRLKLDDSKVHRHLKKLRTLGIIEPAIRIPKGRGSKGGPRATVYKVPDSTIDQVHAAVNLHRRLLSPKYRVAEEMAQLLMDEYLEPREMREISYREILTFIKRKHVTFVVPDIAHLAAQYLHERGVKVWR